MTGPRWELQNFGECFALWLLTSPPIEWRKPVGRLEEAIKVMRLLWESEGPVDFDGQFFKLDGAVLGLDGFGIGIKKTFWVIGEWLIIPSKLELLRISARPSANRMLPRDS